MVDSTLVDSTLVASTLGGSCCSTMVGSTLVASTLDGGCSSMVGSTLGAAAAASTLSCRRLCARFLRSSKAARCVLRKVSTSISSKEMVCKAEVGEEELSLELASLSSFVSESDNFLSDISILETDHFTWCSFQHYWSHMSQGSFQHYWSHMSQDNAFLSCVLLIGGSQLRAVRYCWVGLYGGKGGGSYKFTCS